MTNPEQAIVFHFSLQSFLFGLLTINWVTFLITSTKTWLAFVPLTIATIPGA